MIRTAFSCLPAAALLVLSACSAPAPVGDRDTVSVSIMTFNVENLFDTRHDPGKNDVTFLPLAAKQNAAHQDGCAEISVDYWREQCLHWDWSEAVLEKKLRALAATILQVDDGRGPDIVALQEVENISVLERLRREYLGAAGYHPAVLVEGRDLRGIDVAFLSRLPLAGEPVLHNIPFSGFEAARVADTRGILEATFVLPDGSPLTGYAVHFPAPFHPYPMRIQAYEFLNGLLDRLPAGQPAFAAGDFNTPAREDAEHRLIDKYVRGRWLVAHEQGCADCRGTHYYAPQDSWSFLDMVLWARRDNRPGGGIVPGSVALANRTAAQVTETGTPAGFRLPEATGVSDHWPLLMRVEMPAKQ